MPLVIGGAVAGAPLSSMTLLLFAIVFFWQFPHAIAIAWIYREHYAQANLQVATVKDPSGKLAGVLAVAGAAILLPVSLLPAGQIPGDNGGIGVSGEFVYAVSDFKFRVFQRKCD